MTNTPSDSDIEHMKLAVEISRKSISEEGRHSPFVGAVIVKDGQVVATAYRSEIATGDHAEFTVLEKKLRDQSVAGATVYATLEPCIKRGPNKVPCAERLIERKVARVFVGMLDPNPDICGFGVRSLREAGIDVQLFRQDLADQVEEMNRDFIREQQKKNQIAAQTIESSVNPASNELNKTLARRALQCFPTDVIDRFFREIQTSSIRVEDVDFLTTGYEIFNSNFMRFTVGESRTLFETFLNGLGEVLAQSPSFFRASIETTRYLMRPGVGDDPTSHDRLHSFYTRAGTIHLSWGVFIEHIRNTWPELIVELLASQNTTGSGAQLPRDSVEPVVNVSCAIAFNESGQSIPVLAISLLNRSDRSVYVTSFWLATNDNQDLFCPNDATTLRPQQKTEVKPGDKTMFAISQKTLLDQGRPATDYLHARVVDALGKSYLSDTSKLQSCIVDILRRG